MIIWKSVVGKLWMTIIGLVASVLVILSLWMSNYVDTDFPNSKDQLDNVESMMNRLKKSSSFDLSVLDDLKKVNDILLAERSRIIVVNALGAPVIDPNAPTRNENNEVARFDVRNIFESSELERARKGETLKREFMSSETNKNYIAVAMPITNRALQKNVLVVYQEFRTLGYTNAYIKKLFLYVAVIGILLTTIFAFFLSTKITQPLFQLKKAADLIRLGQYRTRVTIRSSDEIGELANTFNHMAGELEETIKDLNDQREHIASVLRSMTDAVISVNVVGQVILANPPGEDLIQSWKSIASEHPPTNEHQKRSTDPAGILPTAVRELFDNLILQSVLHGTRELTRKINIHQETWSVVLAPLYSRNQIHGAVAVLRNITEETRLEKLRKDFVANVSHELRTPLSMLQGYSEALIDGIVESEEERNSLIQIIHDESVRMSRLVKDLLDLARMEAQKLELDRQTVNMNALLQRVNRKFIGISKEQGVDVAFTLPSEEVIVNNADEDRLEQVFTNLLDNAIRHTPSGESIQVQMELRTFKEQIHAYIELEDHGEGIPADDLPYIFERFWKADKARTRSNKSSGGTGLGLSIVKNIVEAHHGTIKAESIVGEGTIFKIWIPLEASVDEFGHFMVK